MNYTGRTPAFGLIYNPIMTWQNSSTNVLEITAALSAVNKIVTEDMIPAVIGDVSVYLRVLIIYHELCTCFVG